MRNHYDRQYEEARRDKRQPRQEEDAYDDEDPGYDEDDILPGEDSGKEKAGHYDTGRESRRADKDPYPEDAYEDDGYDAFDAYDDFEPDDSERSAGGRRGPKKHRKHHRKHHRKRGTLEILIIAVLGIVFCLCLFMVVTTVSSYLQAIWEYDSIRSLFEVIPAEETEDEEEEETLPYPLLAIDFDALREINSEFVGIIHIPVLDLTYPIAQAENNTDYLTKTFEGTTNSSGCIFLDSLSSPDFSDWNTYVYGHNMKNRTMFGSLKLFMQDEDLCDEDPYIYIYLEDQVLVYRIFAYYTTTVGSDVYVDFYDEDGYDSYISRAISSSMYALEDGVVDWSERPNILTLSTCYSTGHTYNFVVQGALEATYDT